MLEPSFDSALPRYRFLAGLLVSINDSPTREIVRRKLDRHTIAWENAYKVLSHFSRYMREDLMFVFQARRETLHLEGAR